MRAAILTFAFALVLAAGSAARAQSAYLFQRAGERDAELAAARQRDVSLHNDLTTLDARIRTDQALRDTEPGRAAQPARLLRSVRGAAPRPDPGPYVSIPDDRLAASNARVKAAAQNRR
jgi:hypothetical protein